MNKILHNSVLYVNLEQLRRNVRTLLGELEGKALIPVLKGNAYGLGLERIGRELAAFDEIHTLAVAQVSEGAALRDAGVEKDIWPRCPRERPCGKREWRRTSWCWGGCRSGCWPRRSNWT